MTDRYNTADGFIHGHLTNGALADITEPRSTVAAPLEHTQHLEQCAQCQAALADIERVVTALHTPNVVEEPPAGLWDRIAADLDNELDAAASESATAPTDSASETDSTVHQLRPPTQSRGAPWWGIFAAAATGAIIGGVGIAAFLNQDTTEEEPPVASSSIGGATLEPVAADDFTGTADMVQHDDGTMELTVDISSAPDPADGYFEVWLRDDEASQLISLGAVTHDTVTLQVPAGIDLSQYPVVDVSHEHFDGDPSHSGVTLAAGPMETEEN